MRSCRNVMMSLAWDLRMEIRVGWSSQTWRVGEGKWVATSPLNGAEHAFRSSKAPRSPGRGESVNCCSQPVPWPFSL